jgi:hypothetical protein
MKGWNPKSTVLRTTKLVAARLTDLGDYKRLDELAEHAEGRCLDVAGSGY